MGSDIKVEVWVNKWADAVYFVGDLFAIYDKCDRLEPTAYNLKKPKEINIDNVKLSYYKNGFRLDDGRKDLKNIEEIKIEKFERMMKEVEVHD